MSAFVLKKPPVPWYREPWPWLIMLGPATVIVAGLITTAIAFRGADGLVADDYYKQGLAINRVLEREQRALSMHVRGTATYVAATGRVRVQASADTPLPPVLTLRLAHPTRAGMDQTVMLRSLQPGLYEGALQLPESKRWLVTLEGGNWRLPGEWDGHAALRLGAPEAGAAPR
jgi:hypothetical protein